MDEDKLNRSKPAIVVSKIWHEGTSSPFPARLMLQIFELRDALLHNEEERSAFSEAYGLLLENYRECKMTVCNLQTLCDKHLAEVSAGTAAKVHPYGQISILRPIDDQFRGLFKEFFIKGEMVISAIPRVTRVLGLRLGFLFSDSAKFERGAEKLQNEWGELADFVIAGTAAARSTWYKRFNEIRNSIEHGAQKIPSIRYYVDSSSTIIVSFPKTDKGSEFTELLENLADRILELVEGCIVFALATRLKPWQFIKDIPLEERDPKSVVRYKLYARFGDQDIPFSG